MGELQGFACTDRTASAPPCRSIGRDRDRAELARRVL